MRTTLYLWLLAAAAAFAPYRASAAAPAAGADPFEPTVSAAEAQVLAQAAAIAATNLPAAIALVQGAAGPAASPALDYALGNLLAQTNRLDDASAAYGASIRKLPRFRAALNNLGRVQLMQNLPDAAAATLAALVRDGQADADILVLLGHAFTLGAQPVSAESAYRQALLQAPAHPEARRGLAKSLLEQTRYAEAAALLRELTRMHPEDSALWSLQANTLLAQGRTEDALVTLEAAHRLGAATGDMLALQGDLLLNAGRPEDAVAAYTTAFAKTGVAALRQLRAIDGLLQAGAPEAAAQLLRQAEAAGLATATDPDLRAHRQRLAASLAQQQGRIDEARTAFTALLRDRPLDGAALLALGDLERAAGDLEAASQAYERAARIAGFEARGCVRQAEVAVARGRYAAAVPLLEAAQAIAPQPAVGRYLEQVRRLQQ